MGPYSKIGIAFVAIFERFGWKRVGLLHVHDGKISHSIFVYFLDPEVQRLINVPVKCKHSKPILRIQVIFIYSLSLCLLQWENNRLPHHN